MFNFNMPVVHCNKCGIWSSNPRGVRIYRMSCGHFLCEWCFREFCVCCVGFENSEAGTQVPLQLKHVLQEIVQLMDLLRNIYYFESDQRIAILRGEILPFDHIHEFHGPPPVRIEEHTWRKIMTGLQRISASKGFVIGSIKKRAKRITKYVSKTSAGRYLGGFSVVPVKYDTQNRAFDDWTNCILFRLSAIGMLKEISTRSISLIFRLDTTGTSL